MKTLGILGSGQLARMTAIEALRYGFDVIVFCSDKEKSPASHVASETIKGEVTDEKALNLFMEKCDIVTLENEFIDQSILSFIDHKFPQKLYPSSHTFSLIGDKLTEKNQFQKAGIKVVPFKKVSNKDDVLNFIEEHSLPIVIKSTKGGYDGYGNVTVKSIAEIDNAILKLKGELIAEAFIPFEKELAVIVARNKSGDIKTYPIAFTKQENHICHFVEVPAPVNLHTEKEITAIAIKAMESLEAVGVFAFEFFLTSKGELYLNESAPRPHNSGHYSIEGSITSQFQNHVRAVFDLPLGETTLKAPHVLMLNLLGTQNGEAQLQPLNEFLNVQNGHLHLYGKYKSKVGRKMGHYTLLGDDIKSMYEQLHKLKSRYIL